MTSTRIPRSAPRDDTDASRPPARDAGVTLPEIIVSIALIGILIGALMAAVLAGVRSTSIAYNGAQVETVLLNASDRVARAPQLCDYEDYVDAAAIAEQWSPDTISVSVEELVANTGNPSDWQPLAKDCTKNFDPFDVQRLTITASDPSNQITRTLTVVKSDVN